MFNRQKILLALLEAFGGSLSNTDMQKYLFLLTRLQENKSYNFVPYKFGSFSFQAYADKRKLMEKGFLVNEDDWQLAAPKPRYRDMLEFAENDLIWQTKKTYGELKGNALIAHVYKTYPYFAINSTIAASILVKKDLGEIEKARPRNGKKRLYSAGYEGQSLESYLNSLIKLDVRVLCDVRKNALSRKYGFSKKTLQRALDSVGIRYIHIPELGIESDKRRKLKTLKDYNNLFHEYEIDVLNFRSEELDRICTLLDEEKRVALMCFEACPEYCHRTRICNAVIKRSHEILCEVIIGGEN